MNITQFIIMNKKGILIVVLLCVVMSALYHTLSLFTHTRVSPHSMPVEITTFTVTTQTITKHIDLIGSIQYKDKAVISSKVFGRVEKIYVEQGAFVKKGQLMAKIETYPLELQLKESNAELAKAKANCRLAQEKLAQARRTVEQRLKAIAKSKLELTDKYVTLKNTEDILKKKEQLFKVGGITQTELNSLRTNYHTIKTQFLQAKKDYEALIVGFRNNDITQAGYAIPDNEQEKNALLMRINTSMEESEYEAAQSHVAQAETQVEIIKTNIKEAYITSPIHGIVALRSIDIGEKVSEDTNLFVVINTSQVYCIAQANENDLMYIKNGQKADITVDALNKKVFNGTVSIISPMLDQSSRTAEVKVLCTNTGNQLRPGMFARITIFTHTIHNALCIPRNTIKESGNTSVFVIKNNMAFETSITLQEYINEDMAIVSAGLHPNDVIASSQIKLLYDRAKVSIKNGTH